MKQTLNFSYIGNPMRLDKVLSALPLPLSRSQVQKHITLLQLNGKDVKRSAKVLRGDEVQVIFSNESCSSFQNEKYKSSPELTKMIGEIEKDIIYQDEHLCVINKKRGHVVHPGAGVFEPTIAQAVFHLLTSYREEDAIEHRAGIIHRLDKDTSGVMLIAKTAQAHNFYTAQFAQRKVKKIYISILKGIPTQQQGRVETLVTRSPKNRKKFVNVSHKDMSARVDFPKGTRKAISEYEVIYSNKKYSVALWDIKTGRTHQIRLHALHLGTPVLGDALYARAISDEKLSQVPLMLHAFKLRIRLFNDDNDCNENFCKNSIEYKTREKKEFIAPIPKDIKDVLVYLDMANIPE